MKNKLNNIFDNLKEHHLRIYCKNFLYRFHQVISNFDQKQAMNYYLQNRNFKSHLETALKAHDANKEKIKSSYFCAYGNYIQLLEQAYNTPNNIYSTHSYSKLAHDYQFQDKISISYFSVYGNFIKEYSRQDVQGYTGPLATPELDNFTTQLEKQINPFEAIQYPLLIAENDLIFEKIIKINQSLVTYDSDLNATINLEYNRIVHCKSCINVELSECKKCFNSENKSCACSHCLNKHVVKIVYTESKNSYCTSCKNSNQIRKKQKVQLVIQKQAEKNAGDIISYHFKQLGDFNRSSKSYGDLVLKLKTN